jgi:hypothetical protein
VMLGDKEPRNPHSRHICMRVRVLASLLGLCVLCLPACGGGKAVAPDGVFFPTLTKHEDAWPAAEATGTLAERNGCVFLMPGRRLLIWPHEGSIERTDAGTLRITVDGKLVGQTEDQVVLGGGYIGESRNDVSFAEGMIGEQIPERCRTVGGYFLTAPPPPY